MALSLLDHLYENHVFTREECDKVLANATPQDKNRELLQIVEKKSEALQLTYIECLVRSQQRGLADIIRESAVDMK